MSQSPSPHMFSISCRQDLFTSHVQRCLTEKPVFSSAIRGVSNPEKFVANAASQAVSLLRRTSLPHVRLDAAGRLLLRTFAADIKAKRMVLNMESARGSTQPKLHNHGLQVQLWPTTLSYVTFFFGCAKISSSSTPERSISGARKVGGGGGGCLQPQSGGERTCTNGDTQHEHHKPQLQQGRQWRSDFV